MYLKLKKRQIMKNEFPIVGMISISILGVFGLALICLSGIFTIKDYDMLYDCIYKYGTIIIFGMFFLIISLYCWLLFFLNFILPPKKKVLYLYKKENNIAYFKNKKGKKLNCKINKKNLEVNNYYYVLKTQNYIYEILEKTNENWIPKEKKSYFLNFYSPIGNFKGIFLLPIFYVMVLPGLLSILMSEGYQKIYGVIYSIVPIYIITYDLIYKIKLKKSNGNEIDKTKLKKSYVILKNTILIIFVCILCAIPLNILFRLSSLVSKIKFLPVIFCVLCTIGIVFSKIFQRPQLEKLFYKGYVIIFLMYWFGFILFATVGIVEQEKNLLFALFTVPFWLVGFFVLYKCLKK